MNVSQKQDCISFESKESYFDNFMKKPGIIFLKKYKKTHLFVSPDFSLDFLPSVFHILVIHKLFQKVYIQDTAEPFSVE